MKNFEQNLFKFFNELENKTTITIRDFQELKGLLSNAFIKIQRQRERLEESRDNWKNKYFKLKEKN